MKPKILILTHFFKPESCAASIRMQYFYNTLDQSKFEVKVVAPIPNYAIGKNYQGFQKWFVKNENVTYVPIFIPEKDSVIKRFFSYLSYMFSSFFYVLFSTFRPAVIITSSPPIFTAFVAGILSKIYHSKLIFDVRDIWPDIGVELGILKPGLQLNILSKIENFLLTNSNKIIVTINGDKQNLIKKKIKKSAINIIPNGADTEVFKILTKEEIQEIRMTNLIGFDKKVICYFGSFNSGMNDVELIPEILNNISEPEKYHFIAIGSGNSREFVISNIPEKMFFTTFPNLNSEEIAKLVGSSDLTIIPRKEIVKDTGGNIPVKCFESWACGVPVILSTIENTELANIFDSVNFGKRVLPNNPKEFAKACEEVLSKDWQKEKNVAREFVVQNYDRKNNSIKLINILGELLS